MPIERESVRALSKRFRLDPSEAPESEDAGTRSALVPGLALAAIAVGFVVLGGGAREPDEIEARLGLAAAEGIGPFAQVFGGWEPSIPIGRVVTSQLWALFEGGFPRGGVIRWPAVIASVFLGLLIARRVASAMGERAGVLTSLAFLGGLAAMDRTTWTGIEPLSALAIVATLDRLLSRGSDWLAGLGAMAAVLFGGWPALAMVVLPVIVLGRPEARLNVRLFLPPILAFAGWSAWALMATRAEVWASAVALPLTQPPAWGLALWAVFAGLPWSPLAGLSGMPTLRQGFAEPARTLTKGWAQILGVLLIAGTIVPGAGPMAKGPILAGLAILAGAGIDRVLADRSLVGPRRFLTASSLLLALVWGGTEVVLGAKLAAEMPYYRGICFVLVGVGLLTALLALHSATIGSGRGAFRTVLLVAIGMKLAMWGILVPEANYRLGQGPWGRAIGQCVPPRSPIHTLHTWPADLAFATERAVRQLPSEVFLRGGPGEAPRFVLLLPSEFANWSKSAPKLLMVRELQDERGETRILARTEGPLVRRDEE